MSTPRTTPRGPAETTGTIAANAVEGTITKSVLIPVLQLILLTFAGAMQSLPDTGGASAGQSLAILQSAAFVLGVLPVVSTVTSTIAAFRAAHIPGVILYYVMSVGVSGMLNAKFTVHDICLFEFVSFPT